VTRRATACRGLWHMCVYADHWAIPLGQYESMSKHTVDPSDAEGDKKITFIAFKDLVPRGPRDAERHCLQVYALGHRHDQPVGAK
jgi:hypothetical protein